jgi:Fe2+ or Zn2+ uptake regulation protein
MGMAPDDTKRQIRTAVERADEPALSAKQIAERTGLAVKTVNNHIEALTESGDLASTQIGNATAYYATQVRGGSHGEHRHQCRRCGRVVTQTRDMARVDVRQFYDESAAASEHQFYLLCRFCNSDLTAWLFGDTNRDYSHVHKWNIPTDQLRDIQEDETVQTAPTVTKWVSAEEKEVYDLIRRIEQEHDGGAPKSEVTTEYARMNNIDTEDWGLNEEIQAHNVIKKLIDRLVGRGWIERGSNTYRTARDASADGHPEPEAR